MKQIKAYRCDFCGKVSINKLTHHEKYCKKNPVNNHACFDCQFLDVFFVYVDEIRTKQFKCSIDSALMHSYVARKRNLDSVNSTELMPNICDLKQSIQEQP